VVRELIEHWLFFAKGEHGNALDFSLEHATHAGGEGGGIAIGRTDQDLVAVGNGNLFKALDKLGKNGLVMFSTMMPKMRLRPETRLRAWVLGST